MAFYINSPDPLIGAAVQIAEGYRTRAGALKALRAAVKQSAAECRRRYGRAGINKITADYYEIRIGGKQGFHLWERLTVSVAPIQPLAILD